MRPLPKIQMPEDLADHLRLLDPGDDVHFAATVGTTKWVDFVNLFEEPGPATTTLAGDSLAGLNTVTWTYSRLIGLVIFAQRQEDEMAPASGVG